MLPLFLGGDLKTARQQHIRASPLYWVTPDAAPTLCIHGTEDKYVAHEQARLDGRPAEGGRRRGRAADAGRGRARLQGRGRREGREGDARLLRQAPEEMAVPNRWPFRSRAHHAIIEPVPRLDPHCCLPLVGVGPARCETTPEPPKSLDPDAIDNF